MLPLSQQPQHPARQAQSLNDERFGPLDSIATATAKGRRAAASLTLLSSSEDLGHTLFAWGVALYFKCLAWLTISVLLALPFAGMSAVLLFKSHWTSSGDALQHLPSTWRAATSSAALPTLASFSFASLPDPSSPGAQLLDVVGFAGGYVRSLSLSRPSFLLVLGYLDAAATWVLLLSFLLMGKSCEVFTMLEEHSCVAVEDFSVLVRGLPASCTQRQVAEHFTRFGHVVDVVLVSAVKRALHLGGQVEACLPQLLATAEALPAHFPKQQQGTAGNPGPGPQDAAPATGAGNVLAVQSDALGARPTPALVATKDVDQQDAPPTVQSQLHGSVACVTFDARAAWQRCRDTCPRGWPQSLLMPASDRFLARHRFWVEPAAAPEDTIYSNLGIRSDLEWSCRWAAFPAAALILLPLTAILLGTVQTHSLQPISSVHWAATAVLSASGSTSTGGTSTASAPAVLRAPFGTNRVAPGENWTAVTQVCGELLQSYCQAELTRRYKSTVYLRMGQLARWNDTGRTILLQYAAVQDMKAALSRRARASSDLQTSTNTSADSTTGRNSGASSTGSGIADASNSILAACYTCYCYGISTSLPQARGREEQLKQALEVKGQCAPFVGRYSAVEAVQRAGLSLTVIGVNILVLLLMRLVVKLEPHATCSSKEQAYARYTFAMQLINSSLLVLLASSPTLKGTFRDLSPTWYLVVGSNLLLVQLGTVILDTASIYWPVVVAWVCGAGRMGATDVKPTFTLEDRVGGVSCVIAVALLFGSGLPVLYIVAAAGLALRHLTERHSLMRLCKPPVHYQCRLPKLIAEVVPFALVGHCVFGVWMHSYFWAPARASGAASTLQILASSQVGQHVPSRLKQPNSVPLLVTLVLLVVFLIARQLAKLFCMPSWRSTKHAAVQLQLQIKRGQQVAVGGHSTPALSAGPLTFSVLRAQHRIRGPASYRAGHHPLCRSLLMHPRLKQLAATSKTLQELRQLVIEQEQQHVALFGRPSVGRPKREQQPPAISASQLSFTTLQPHHDTGSQQQVLQQQDPRRQAAVATGASPAPLPTCSATPAATWLPEPGAAGAAPATPGTFMPPIAPQQGGDPADRAPSPIAPPVDPLAGLTLSRTQLLPPLKATASLAAKASGGLLRVISVDSEVLAQQAAAAGGGPAAASLLSRPLPLPSIAPRDVVASRLKPQLPGAAGGSQDLRTILEEMSKQPGWKGGQSAGGSAGGPTGSAPGEAGAAGMPVGSFSSRLANLRMQSVAPADLECIPDAPHEEPTQEASGQTGTSSSHEHNE